MDMAVNFPAFPKERTICSRMEAIARENPDKASFVFIDSEWDRIEVTRKDLWDWSRRFASYLKRLGVQKGDVVCNALANSPQRLLTHLGTVNAGAIPLHGQVMLADGKDFFVIMERSKCSTAIVDPGEGKGAHQFLESVKFVNEQGETRYEGLPDLVNVIHIDVCGPADSGRSQYDAWLDSLSKEDLYVNETIDQEDIAVLFLTSGTTGFSKIVAHSHAVLIEIGVKLGYVSGVFDENAVFISDRSLGWAAGQPIVAISSGCTRVMTNHCHGRPENYGSFITQVILQEKVDCGFIVPFDLSQILVANEGKEDNPPFKLRHVSTGGGPLPKKIKKFLGFLTETLEMIYGSTEALFVTSLRVKDLTNYKPMCVGKAVPGVEIILVDPDLQEVPLGKTGEVAIRSTTDLKGYYRNPEKNKVLWTPDGCLRTGDVGFKDDEGFLFICNRMSDAIMRGPYIHYPGWLETRILAFDGIQEVAIVGVPDETLHEEVCACILPTSSDAVSEEDLKKFCDELFVTTDNKELVPVPKYFLFFEDFPRNPNGKTRRPVLKEEAAERLKLKH